MSTNSFENVYDVSIDRWDGKENMLNDYRDKVTLFINVTTDCGNAPEYRIIQSIYEKYKDQGFEVVAIPTNEYCGEFIVYDEFVNGINSALDAKNFAENAHGVTYNFSELVYSNPSPPVPHELFEELYPGRMIPYPIQLPKEESPHPLFLNLGNQSENKFHWGYGLAGNFEKFLVDRSGEVVGRYGNGSLMPRSYEPEYGQKFGLSGSQIQYDVSHNHIKERSGALNYDILCQDIESVL